MFPPVGTLADYGYGLDPGQLKIPREHELLRVTTLKQKGTFIQKSLPCSFLLQFACWKRGHRKETLNLNEMVDGEMSVTNYKLCREC